MFNLLNFPHNLEDELDESQALQPAGNAKRSLRILLSKLFPSRVKEEDTKTTTSQHTPKPFKNENQSSKNSEKT
ncbi:MAG: hypothetical protein KatS3mg029_0310 [Saprospiraceae bacterium]|nr:MAG: hypothetical protein KatS3mg029_0310 [Saprospiraceae bacterium]